MKPMRVQVASSSIYFANLIHCFGAEWDATLAQQSSLLYVHLSISQWRIRLGDELLPLPRNVHYNMSGDASVAVVAAAAGACVAHTNAHAVHVFKCMCGQSSLHIIRSTACLITADIGGNDYIIRFENMSLYESVRSMRRSVENIHIIHCSFIKFRITMELRVARTARTARTAFDS